MSAMQVFEFMVTSVMINVCVLIVLIATWMVRRRPPASSTAAAAAAAVHEQQLRAGLEDLETKTASLLVSDNHLAQKVSAGDSNLHTNANEVHILSSVITSSFCSISGLYLTASPYIWENPFVATRHSHTDAVTSFEGNHASNEDRVWTTHEAASTVLLSATFGCFIFALFHLAAVCNQLRTRSLWTVFRVGYLVITLVTFTAIINTKENLLGASLILLMEVDSAVEGICQLVDASPVGNNVRTVRKLLSVVGCVASVGTRIVMTWTMSILLGKLYNPMAMSVVSLGISSFGFIFYQAYTLLVIKKHVDQLKVKLTDADTKETNNSMAVEARHEKSKSLRSKAVAFHLMNEGLVEISTYAKTVAGAITDKKLRPIRSLCDSFSLMKPGNQSHCPSLPRK